MPCVDVEEDGGGIAEIECDAAWVGAASSWHHGWSCVQPVHHHASVELTKPNSTKSWKKSCTCTLECVVKVNQLHQMVFSIMAALPPTAYVWTSLPLCPFQMGM